MIVSELIQKLSTLDPNMDIVIDDYMYSTGSIEISQSKVQKLVKQGKVEYVEVKPGTVLPNLVDVIVLRGYGF